MFNFKKLTATALSLTMAFSMSACGSSEKKGNTSVDAKSVKTIDEAVAIADEYNCGNYEANFDITAKQGSKDVSIKLGMDGKVNGDDSTAGIDLSLKTGSESVGLSFDDFIVFADNKAYIDFDAVLNGLSGADTKLGSYGIKMPVNKNKDSIQKKASKLSAALVKTAFENVEVESDGNGKFVITIDDGKDFYNVAVGFIEAIDENADAMNDIYNESIKGIDYEKWIDDVVNDLADDIADAAEKMGAQVSKSDIKSMADEIKSEIPEIEDVDFADGLKEITSEAKEALGQVSKDDFAEMFDSMFDEAKMVITVELTDKSYKVDVKAVIAGDDVSINVKCNYEIELENVKISKPANATTISKMIDYISENPEVFQDVAEGMEKLGNEFERFSDIMDEL